MPILGELPNSIRRNARHVRLSGDVPAMLVRPESGATDAPLFIWMHGRTANKELDPGRYIRLMRAGIASCALDLPGHGERLDPRRQEPGAIVDVIQQMLEELDPVLEDLRSMDTHDATRIGIGGISAGGIVTLLRMTREHDFRCAAVEATTGNRAFRSETMSVDDDRLEGIDVMNRLEDWREVPLLAVHNRFDEWIDVAGQEVFMDTLRKRYDRPELVELHVYEERTGAPFEHAGFGRFSPDAKDRQVAFLCRHLGVTT
ncbi:MAG: alpha/beta fold hydrolase [Phycisphaerales bacterium]|nr:alpha/beta fold hydrolase [Phycisphaerales bacterium]